MFNDRNVLVLLNDFLCNTLLELLRKLHLVSAIKIQ